MARGKGKKGGNKNTSPDGKAASPTNDDAAVEQTAPEVVDAPAAEAVANAPSQSEAAEQPPPAEATTQRAAPAPEAAEAAAPTASSPAAAAADAAPAACLVDTVVKAPTPRFATISPRRAHPAALPSNDSDHVAALRAKLRVAKSQEEQLTLAQEITEARYPLPRSAQKKMSAERDAAFVKQFGPNDHLHKVVEQAHQQHTETTSPRVEDASATPASVTSTTAPLPEKESAFTAANQDAADAEVANVAVTPATAPMAEMTDEQAEEFQRNTIDELRKILADIERMKDRQDEWKALLEAMFAQEVDEDQRARRLFAEVMTSEAFFLGDREFREWMSKHESKGEGVGGEGLLDWYLHDVLVSLTPYLAFVPCPRNMTATGEREFGETVDRVLRESRSSNDESFRVLAYPVQPHHSADAAALDANAELPLVRTGNDVIELVRDNAVVKQFLDTTKAVFFGSADLPSTTTIVRAFVAAGELLGVEPYSSNDITLSTTLGALDDSKSRGLIARAVTRLFAAGFRQAFGARTYCFIARLDVNLDGDLEARLLNVGPMDAREYSQFSWTDLVGLMATARVTRRRLRLPTAGGTLQRLNADVYDVEDAWKSVTVRGTIQFVAPTAKITEQSQASSAPPSSAAMDTLAPKSTTSAPQQSVEANVSAATASVDINRNNSATAATATPAAARTNASTRAPPPPPPPVAQDDKSNGGGGLQMPGPLFWVGAACIAFAAVRVLKPSGA